MTDALPTLADVRAAADRLAGVAHQTPLITSRRMDERLGFSLFLKAENLQRGGAFKFRGALNTVAQLTDEARARGVITYSSGNHGQALALAARLLGSRCVVVMPTDAARSKVAACEGYGAEVVFAGRSSDDRMNRALELAEAHGYEVVPPYADARVIAGQGTAALEILADVPDLDTLVVPVGGGGLLAGCALAAKAIRPTIRVIGVETEAAQDAYRSFRAGSIQRITLPDTIADGMRNLQLGDPNFALIQRYVDDIVLVTDREVILTMRDLLSTTKLLVEPTGAVAPAAVLTGKVTGGKVAAILSGGNVDLDRLATFLVDGANS